VQKVIDEYLERDFELLGVTGVEDKLQQDVRPSLELLRDKTNSCLLIDGEPLALPLQLSQFHEADTDSGSDLKPMRSLVVLLSRSGKAPMGGTYELLV